MPPHPATTGGPSLCPSPSPRRDRVSRLRPQSPSGRSRWRTGLDAQRHQSLNREGNPALESALNLEGLRSTWSNLEPFIRARLQEVLQVGNRGSWIQPGAQGVLLDDYRHPVMGEIRDRRIRLVVMIEAVSLPWPVAGSFHGPQRPANTKISSSVDRMVHGAASARGSSAIRTRRSRPPGSAGS